MEKTKKLTTKKVILLIVALFLVSGCALGGIALAQNSIKRVATDEEYSYINPDETKAETDEGFKIDGVLDEEEYQNNHWLYLQHKDDSTQVDVDIAMTSHYGDKGMYFVFDVTDRKTVYVNLDRKSVLNTCVEMYLAPNYVMERNSHMFEIDLLPTGDMVFKKINGKGSYVNVRTTNDIMAYLGATTKGGEVNTPECTGFYLELFIPWDYLETFGINTDEMKKSYAYASPAYITSYNYDGEDSKADRYWYNFGEQHGVVGTSPVFQYYRFDAQGVRGTVPTKVVAEENCTVTGATELMPGMKTTYTITPDKGYAVNSVLVNGKEYIQKLNYNEDGTAMLTIRGKTEGLEIKATAETVTEGNKTLSGILTVDEGGFDGVTIKYKGKNGLKDLPIDAKGSFTLENMPQGYYLIKAQKEGYEALERGIYLNRDMNIDLFLQYIEFIPENSSSWILDGEDEGVLQRFGGRGIIRTKKSYDKFTAEINLKYDTEVATEYEHDYFTQQRQGARITFGNGKEWNLHLVKLSSGYTLHYIPFAGDNAVFPKSESIYLLSEQEIAKYTGKEGLTLKIVRDGKYVNLWLDDKLITVEILDEEYAKCTAQVGFEAWAATSAVQDYKYSITSDAKNMVKHALFRVSAGWDVSGQYDGYISMPKGGSGRLQFTNKFTAMDLTIKARDYVGSDKPTARTDVLFLFNVNGVEKHISVGFSLNQKGVTLTSQNKDGADDGNQIYTKWKSWGSLTKDEKELYLGEGIDLRLVRYGTELLIYLGDRFVNVIDLTNNNSGITANTEATVVIRHYGDVGLEVVMPFELKTKLTPITINSVESEYGKVVGKRKTYFVGDKVTLVGDEKDGYYCKAMKVNGKDVQMNLDGSYSFTATEMQYTVEGTSYGKRVFQNNGEWNSFAQDEGVVILPNGGGTTDGALKTAKKYGNVSFKVTAREYADGAKKGRTDIGLIFENGRHISFSITENDTQAWVEVWNYNAIYDPALQIHPNSMDLGVLTADEKTAYDSDTGVEFRVVRYGTDAYIYVGERLLAGVDLTANKSGVTADMKAEIRLRHFDDKNVEIEIPFELTTELPPLVTIESVEGEYGKVVGKSKIYFLGDTVTLVGDEKGDYYCKAMKVNGKDVQMNLDGSYSFTATEKHYTVEGTSYGKRIFQNNSEWNSLAQDEGIVTLPNGGGTTGGALKTAKKYGDVSFKVTAREYAQGTKKGRTDIGLIFENGRHISFSIIEDATQAWVEIWNYNAIYSPNLQIHPNSMDLGVLTTAEKAAYDSNTGVEFRVVREGTDADIYIGKRLIATVDLTANNSGVTADMKAEIRLRHMDDSGVEVEIPFELTTELPTVVTIESVENEYGKVVSEEATYFVGDTITLFGDAKDDYYCKAMKVNGKDVQMNLDGTYTFTATKEKYTVEGTFGKRVFQNNSEWNTFAQDEGVVTLPNGGGTTGGALKTTKKYRDVSFKVTAREYAQGTRKGRTDIGLIFENGRHISFSIIENDTQAWVEIWNYNAIYSPDLQIHPNSMDLGVLTATEKDTYDSNTGVEFRVVREGTDADIYIGERLIATVDLTANDSGVTADMKAEIRLRHMDDSGVEVEIPFEIATSEDEATVTCNASSNGTVTTNNTTYMVGDTVVLTVTGDQGYACNSLKINGVEVDKISADGTYSFEATQKSYNISATFTEKIFVDNGNWNLINQNKGIVALPNGGGTTGGALKTAKKYGDVSFKVTAREYAQGTRKGRTDIGLIFENGSNVSFSITENDTQAWVESWNYDKNNGGLLAIYPNSHDWGLLTAAEKAAYDSNTGVEFRVVREGTNAYIYIGERLLATVDLTANNSGVTADMKVEIRLRHFDDSGVEVEIPFVVSDEVAVSQAVQTNMLVGFLKRLLFGNKKSATN